jgi:hypothetical protein
MHGHVILGIPHQPHDIGQTLMMHVGAIRLVAFSQFRLSEKCLGTRCTLCDQGQTNSPSPCPNNATTHNSFPGWRDLTALTLISISLRHSFKRRHTIIAHSASYHDFLRSAYSTSGVFSCAASTLCVLLAPNIRDSASTVTTAPQCVDSW